MEGRFYMYINITHLSQFVNKHGRHRNFTESIHGRSSIRLPHFIPIGQKSWSPWAILVSVWLKFKTKSAPLKLGGTMNCYFGGMKYRRSCTKCPYFMRSGKVLFLFYLRILITPLVSSNSSFRLVENIDNRIKSL